MAQAVPPHPPAPEVVAHVQKVADAPDGGAYTPVPGLPHLREAFAHELASAYGARIVPENVLITAGCNQAFALLASTLANPGDEVILPLPFYFNHEMAVVMAGCRPVIAPTDARYQLQVDAIASAITPHTRAVVTISPNNPSGAVYPEADLRAVLALDAVLLADEPVSGFDLPLRDRIIELLDGLVRDRGLGLVLVSHDLDAVARLCGRSVVLAGGRIVEEGPTDRLLAHPAHPATRELADAVPRLPGAVTA